MARKGSPGSPSGEPSETQLTLLVLRPLPGRKGCDHAPLLSASLVQIFRNAREQGDKIVANRDHDRHDRDRDPRRDQTVLDGRRAGLIVPVFSQLAGD